MNATADEVSEAPHRRLAYLPALDGVRAFAVVAVMLFHGGISIGTGGFMGVDTFFVLSGFLITSLLVSEWRESMTIKLSAFWARRARRLLPALLLMLVLVAIFVAAMGQGSYPAVRLDALSTLLYVSNWHFLLVHSNYFNEVGRSPLLHTWSLAVEEQFYLIWPLVVLGLLKITKSLRTLFGLCVVAAAGSAIEMVLLYNPGDNSRVYYGTDTRSQCLFIGCALAVGLVLLTQRSHASGRLKAGELWAPASSTGRAVCVVAGLIGAGVSLWLWDSSSGLSSFPFQGGILIIGLATAGVILAAVGAPNSPIPRVLSLRPVRYVGKISYGLYLWHLPLFIWLDAGRVHIHNTWGLFALRAVVSVFVAVLSFHVIEQPIRRGTFLKQWQAYVAVPTAAVVVVVATVAATVGTTAAAAGGGSGPIPAPIGLTTTTTAPPGVATTTTTLAPSSPVRVLLLGDSIALTLGFGMASSDLQSKYNYVLSDDGILGCGVVMGPEVELMGVRAQTPSACNGSSVTPGEVLKDQPWPYQWLNAMAVTHPNVVVLLAGRWEVVNREYNGQWTNILNPTFAAYVKHQLELTSALVTASGANMVFLTAPCTDEGEAPDGAPWPEDDPARITEYNKLVRQVAQEHPSTDSVVDLFAATCPGGKFSTDIDGKAVRRSDGVHFTPDGGDILGPKLMPAIVASGRAQMTRSSAAG
jgi:peptidoglycan/LPS O-acetylase OafA/YrhL